MIIHKVNQIPNILQTMSLRNYVGLASATVAVTLGLLEVYELIKHRLPSLNKKQYKAMIYGMSAIYLYYGGKLYQRGETKASAATVSAATWLCYMVYGVK